MRQPPRTAHPKSLVLATDLDGTFAGGTPGDRARLQGAIAASENAVLVYVTGRTVEAARALMRVAPLPVPDVLIADVGTSVASGPELRPVGEIEARIDEVWPGAPRVREALLGTPGIEEQDIVTARRLSYWLREGRMEAVLRRMSERLEGEAVDLVGSAETYIDVLPAGVNKGSTLLRVLDWLGIREADVVVAGDTLNDLALFQAGLRGIVVGNCEPALRERLEGSGGGANLYFARGAGAAGVFEGLVHFQCLNGGADGE